MVSSGMLRLVALVRADVSEEHITSNIRLTRIELGRMLAVTSNRYPQRVQLLKTANVIPSSPILVTLMMEEICSTETSFLTRPTRRNIPEDGILHSHSRENLKSYVALTVWAMERRSNMSPVKYELVCYIPEDDILVSILSDLELRAEIQ
jgi:hypothetical protein